MTRPLMVIGLVCWASFAVAQSVGVHVQWDPPTVAEPRVSYDLYVDALPMQSVPVVIDANCGCISVPIGVSVGSHSVSVAGVYQLIDGDPNSVVETAKVTVAFVINGGGQVKNIKVTK